MARILRVRAMSLDKAKVNMAMHSANFSQFLMNRLKFAMLLDLLATLNKLMELGGKLSAEQWGHMVR